MYIRTSIYIYIYPSKITWTPSTFPVFFPTNDSLPGQAKAHGVWASWALTPKYRCLRGKWPCPTSTIRTTHRTPRFGWIGGFWGSREGGKINGRFLGPVNSIRWGKKSNQMSKLSAQIWMFFYLRSLPTGLRGFFLDCENILENQQNLKVAQLKMKIIFHLWVQNVNFLGWNS